MKEWLKEWSGVIPIVFTLVAAAVWIVTALGNVRVENANIRRDVAEMLQEDQSQAFDRELGIERRLTALETKLNGIDEKLDRLLDSGLE